MTKKIHASNLSDAALATLSELTPNYTYELSIDAKGDITSLAIIGLNKAKKKLVKRTTSIPTDVMSRLIRQTLESVSAGSMVIAFKLYPGDPDAITRSHELGAGHIVYIRKPLKTANTLEDILVELTNPEAAYLYAEQGLVIRHKRRQGKWYLCVGSFVPELPASSTPTDNVSIYSLESRSHLSSSTSAEPKSAE